MKAIKKVMLMLCALLVVSACSYDDEEIWSKVNDHEARISALEDWQKQVNNNITALQELLNTQDYITKVSPLVENGVEVGYTIEFAKSEPITLYHGKKGESGDAGNTPVISLTKEKDGNWYWTLNGELMKDEKGNPIRANGLDGKDGEDGKDGADGEDGKDGHNGSTGATGPAGRPAPTPQVSLGSKLSADANIANEDNVEATAVYLSVDGGSTWYRISGEKGSSGSAGEDNQGITVTLGTDYVTFTLEDGQSFKVPYYGREDLANGFKIGTDEGNDALEFAPAIIKYENIHFTFPEDLQKEDVSGIIAEIIQENGLNDAIVTRAKEKSISLEIVTGDKLEDYYINLKHQYMESGDTYMLRATLTKKDGTSLVTSRGIRFMESEMKIGDILYSDGSFSTVLIEGKTPIGIIFSLDPDRIGEAEKEALAAKGVTKPTGLAIALKDASLSGNKNYYTDNPSGTSAEYLTQPNHFLWCTGDILDKDEGQLNLKEPGDFKDETFVDCFQEDFSVCMNDISGLEKCQTIWNGQGAYGDLEKYPVFNAAKHYADDNSDLTEKTTDYFLPSVGQWIDILSNLGKVSFEENTTYDENVEYFKINTLPQDNILNSINSYFDKIPSASELSFVDSNKRNVIYHTSSEGDNYRGTRISYNNYGTKSLSIYFVDKDRFALGGNFACRARCILAF